MEAQRKEKEAQALVVGLQADTEGLQAQVKSPTLRKNDKSMWPSLRAFSINVLVPNTSPNVCKGTGRGRERGEGGGDKRDHARSSLMLLLFTCILHVTRMVVRLEYCRARCGLNENVQTWRQEATPYHSPPRASTKQKLNALNKHQGL